MHGFSRFPMFLYSKSLKCLVHVASYALRIQVCHGVVGSEFVISHTHKHYISIVHIENFLLYVLGLFVETIPYILNKE